VNLAQALGGMWSSPVAIVGAGGKSSFMLELARQSGPLALVTTTTHLGKSQVERADYSVEISNINDWDRLVLPETGVVAITGGDEDGLRVRGPEIAIIEKLAELASDRNIPLLIEADGARNLPVKAPARHEPAIPDFVHSVVVIAGVKGVGQSILNAAHRPVEFARLAGCTQDERITPEHIVRVLIHGDGGLKKIPPRAARIAVINQADTTAELAIAGRIARMVTNSGTYDLALVTGLHHPVADQVGAVFRSTAAIVLAAGEARRCGSMKQLLEMNGESLVHRSVRIALESGLNPVAVVVGANDDLVAASVADLPVAIVRNDQWRLGPGTSIRAGVRAIQALSPRCGAAFFLMADQPYVDVPLIRCMIEEQAATAKNVIAPMVDGQRVSPVLFARAPFEDLLQLADAASGKAIFSRHSPHLIPWLNSKLALDVDTPEDWQMLNHE